MELLKPILAIYFSWLIIRHIESNMYIQLTVILAFALIGLYFLLKKNTSLEAENSRREMPEFVKGVINLRGIVIPVVDLRLRFGMETIDYTERTCIIVVEIEGNAGTVMIGIVVDSVSEVLNIKGDDIENTPTFGTKLDTDYILGMAKMEGGVKILLDIDLVLNTQDIELLEKAA